MCIRDRLLTIIKINNTIINDYYIQSAFRGAFGTSKCHKYIHLSTLMLEMGLAFRSIGVSTKDAFQSIVLSWPKKNPLHLLVCALPNHLFPIASASQYGHYYLQTYVKIAG